MSKIFEEHMRRLGVKLPSQVIQKRPTSEACEIPVPQSNPELPVPKYTSPAPQPAVNGIVPRSASSPNKVEISSQHATKSILPDENEEELIDYQNAMRHSGPKYFRRYIPPTPEFERDRMFEREKAMLEEKNRPKHVRSLEHISNKESFIANVNQPDNVNIRSNVDKNIVPKSRGKSGVHI